MSDFTATLRAIRSPRFRPFWLSAWVWLAAVGLVPAARAQVAGFIHVVCEPGVQVTLDNKPQGVTELKNEGLIIDDVTPGSHRVGLIREGFEPQEQIVQVEEGQLAECRAGPFKRAAAAAAPAAQGAAGGRTLADIKLELILIRPGTFQMGSSAYEPNHQANEGPQTQVRITREFWLGKTEVTRSQYGAIMNPNSPELSASLGSRPMATVSWIEAKAFCAKLTNRERAAGRLPAGYVFTLPTEAQWEFACRAGTTGASTGSLDAQAWYSSPRIARTAVRPVGQKKPNAWGLYDIEGNVSEWCLTCYVEKLPGGVIDDPRGPLDGAERVVRGGAYDSLEEHCRPAWRGHEPPEVRSASIGFRVALAPP